MDKELTDVSSYVKTINYVDLSTVLGEDGCNDKVFLEYLDNDNYNFGTNALTLATEKQLTNTIHSYADNLLKRKLWITPALVRLRNLPEGTFINLED